MDDLGLVQPRCLHCGTVMIADRRGFWCERCRHLEDHATELADVMIPPDFDGPSIRGG